MTMPPQFRFLIALTSKTVSKMCSHYKLLQLSPSTVSNLISKQSYHTSAELWNSFNRIQEPFMNKPSQTTSTMETNLVGANRDSDQVLRKWQGAKSVEAALSIVGRHLSEMSKSLRFQAIQDIYHKMVNKQTRMSKEDIINSSEFKNLCDSCLSHLRFENLNCHLSCLKCLTYLGVSSNTEIMHLLLKLISKQVKDLTLDSITYVDYLISLQDGSPLVEALQRALRMVFDIKVEKEVNKTDIKHLERCLKYAARSEVSSSSFNLIVSILSAYDEPIPPENAGFIVQALSKWPEYNDSYAPLLLRVMDIFAKSVDELSLSHVQCCLWQVMEKAKYHKAFLHVTFFEHCIKKILKCDSQWQSLLYMLGRVQKFNFSSPELANAVCNKVVLNWEEFLCYPAETLRHLLIQLSHLENLKPKNWDLLEPLALEHLRKHINNDDIYWPRVSLALGALDSWPCDIFNKVVEEDYLTKWMESGKKRGNYIIRYRIIANNHQAVRLLFPGDFSGSIPPHLWEKITSVLRAEYKANLKSPSPLLPALAEGLGGTEYLYSNVVTQHLHFIDHLIVMRKGGYPAAAHPISSEDKLINLEDIPVPPGSLLVGVLPIKPKQYSINGEVLRGNQALYHRTLQAMGIAVVPILLSKWDALLEREKIPYLMQEIRTKTEDHEVMTRL